jgi:hypothetical protein
MNIKHVVFLSVLCLSVTGDLFAQGTAGRRVPEFSSRQEYVSLDSTMPFDRAVAALSEISKRFSGKIIIDPQERASAIGVSIKGLHWRDALDLIGEANFLRVIEKTDYIELRSVREGAKVPPGGGGPTKVVVGADTREVLISTIFFALDVTKAESYGIDWSFSFFRGKDSVTGVFNPGGEAGALKVDYSRPYQYGNLASTLRLFSQKGLGQVISSPRIIVRSMEKGRVQVGRDISIIERQFTAAGATEAVRQISTGTIVEVTPEVIREGDIEFVSLDLNVDRSSSAGGAAPTIDKNQTTTKLLLLDGEEVFISGLYTTEEKTTRTGIPILKDLPWWFLGLRYIFGTEEKTVTTQELVILLKADILPTLKDRVGRRERENVLERMRKKFEQDVERLKTKQE